MSSVAVPPRGRLLCSQRYSSDIVARSFPRITEAILTAIACRATTWRFACLSIVKLMGEPYYER